MPPPKFFFASVSISQAASSARGEPLGRIEIETFDDVVPRTAANFRALCSAGSVADARNLNPAGLTYRGNVFHRIVTGFMVTTK
jgi:cyclophilin family peptidyl-prolyl cis-trans isomerase